MKTQQLEDFAIEGAGGGGCFVAGTQVSTPNGTKSIETLVVGDTVMCFPEDNTQAIVIGKVIQTFVHTKEENNSDIYSFTFDDGTVLDVTGNHYIQTIEGTFEYAANYTVGDQFVGIDGQFRLITAVEVRPVDELVYNLEVWPHHTYVANGMRVHNGGGGKDSGSPARAAQEAPNTLSSSATAMVVEVISEGEIVGLVNGAQTIYLDGTPVQNSDGTFNYDRFAYDTRYGLPDQPYMPGFPDVEAEEMVNVIVTHDNDVVRQMNDPDIDAARVTINMPQGLYKQDKSNGDVNGFSVQIAIDVRIVGGVWYNQLVRTISGKSMTPYEEAYRIERPNGAGDWQVRIRRGSVDDADSSMKSIVNWARFTKIKDKKLQYNNSAYVGLKVDAKSTGGNVPKRSYRIKGIKCQVPVNYNPDNHTYTGEWNGYFKTAWTDNPAWIVYDLITNDRYGLGTFIEPSMLDKYSFYDCARYNDGYVSNGNGGTEPRFTFNGVMNTRQDAWKLVQAVASSCRAIVYYGAGLIRIIQDRPTSTSLIVNKSDVLNGMFEYASTSMQQRHPVIQVTYNAKDDRYQPATITVEDLDGTARYGYNVKEVIAYGATTEGQARRLGLWSLYTELNITESVKFQCGLNLATRLQPGSVVKVVDEELMGVPFGGRIINATTAGGYCAFYLDRPVDLLAGQTYTLEWINADGITVNSATVLDGAGTRTTLSIASPAVLPQAGMSWVLTSSTFAGKLYRIYSVKESGSSQFEVTALQYIPEKYTEVDQVVNPESWTPTQKVLNWCPAPYDLSWGRETGTDSYGRRVVNLRCNWKQEDEQYIATYLVSYRRNDSQMTNSVVTSHREFVIPNVMAGTYEVNIYAINVSNVKSKVVIGTYYNDLSGGVSPMLAPINLAVSGTGGNVWGGTDLSVSWEQNPANDNVGEAVFKSYYLTIHDPDTNDILRTVEVTEPKYTYSFVYNNSDTHNAPRRNIKVRVFNKDSLNRTSTDIFDTFTNPAPGAPSFTLQGGYQFFGCNITPPAGVTDVAGYYVAVIPNLYVTPQASHIVYNGSGANVTIPYYDVNDAIVRVACYDGISKKLDELIWADPKTVNVPQALAVIDSVEGYKFFTLVFKQNDPAANKVSWTASQVVRTTDAAQKSCPAGNATWAGSAVYLYYNWDTNTIVGTTNLNDAVGIGKAILATYYGGKTLNMGNGDAYIDGGKLLAQTVGASSIVAGTITAQEIAANTITGNKLVTDSAVITTSAQIANLIVDTGKIKDLTVTTLKIADQAVTIHQVYHYTTDVTLVPNTSPTVIDTFTFTGNGDNRMINLLMKYWADDGMVRGYYIPGVDFSFNTNLYFEIEISHNSGTVIDYSGFIYAGAGKGSMFNVGTVNSGNRYVIGNYPWGTTAVAAPIRSWEPGAVSADGAILQTSFLVPTTAATTYTLKLKANFNTAYKNMGGSALTNNYVEGYALDRIWTIMQALK